jgi:hypothetical protein
MLSSRANSLWRADSRSHADPRNCEARSPVCLLDEKREAIDASLGRAVAPAMGRSQLISDRLRFSRRPPPTIATHEVRRRSLRQSCRTNSIRSVQTVGPGGGHASHKMLLTGETPGQQARRAPWTPPHAPANARKVSSIRYVQLAPDAAICGSCSVKIRCEPSGAAAQPAATPPNGRGAAMPTQRQVRQRLDVPTVNPPGCVVQIRQQPQFTQLLSSNLTRSPSSSTAIAVPLLWLRQMSKDAP